MSKRIVYAVAAVLKKTAAGDEVLVVKRPDEDPDLGGYWGFPATPLKPGELPEAAVVRACREKLHCKATPVRLLGIMLQRHADFDMYFMDIEVVLAAGEEPDVHAAVTQGTAYVGQKWSIDPNDLIASAKAGSCCSSIFLTDRGLLERDEWIASLEDSDAVA